MVKSCPFGSHAPALSKAAQGGFVTYCPTCGAQGAVAASGEAGLAQWNGGEPGLVNLLVPAIAVPQQAI